MPEEAIEKRLHGAPVMEAEQYPKRFRAGYEQGTAKAGSEREPATNDGFEQPIPEQSRASRRVRPCLDGEWSPKLRLSGRGRNDPCSCCRGGVEVRPRQPHRSGCGKQLLCAEEELSVAQKRHGGSAQTVYQLETRDNEADLVSFSVWFRRCTTGPSTCADRIRKADIDIYDIRSARINWRSFLAYVNQLKATMWTVAGEFIYTASLLIHIKARCCCHARPRGRTMAGSAPICFAGASGQNSESAQCQHA